MERHRDTHRHSFAFFYEKASQVQPQEETEERLRKTKFIILTGPRDTPVAHRTGPQGKDTRVVRRQERGECSVQGLYWSFPGKGKAGQREQFRTG